MIKDGDGPLEDILESGMVELVGTDAGPTHEADYNEKLKILFGGVRE